MHKTRTDTVMSVLPLHTRALTSYEGYDTHSATVLHVCLDLGMSLKYLPYSGPFSILDMAIRDLDDVCVELLMLYGADINYGDGFHIRNAAHRNDLRVVSLLIKVGANANAGNGYTSAISEALMHASYEIVSQLLRAGAILPSVALALAQNTYIDRDLKVSCVLVWRNPRLIPSRQSVQ